MLVKNYRIEEILRSIDANKIKINNFSYKTILKKYIDIELF